MAGVGAALFFTILLVWVPAAALFFDAAERRQSPYLWGALAVVPFLNVVVVGAYLLLRGRAGEETTRSTRLVAYLHIGVLTFWALVAVGLNGLFYAPIRFLRSPATPEEYDEPRGAVFRQTLAFALALLVIAIPALTGHLLLLRRSLADTAEAVLPRVGRMNDALGMLLTVLGGLVVTLSVVLLVFEGIGRLLSVGSGSVFLSTIAISALVPAAISIVGSLLLFPRGERAPAAGGA